MANITHKGAPVTTIGFLPALKSQAPDFELTKTDMTSARLSDYRGKKVILNIFPSLDTSTCAMSVRRFNEAANSLPDTMVLCISADLPYAQSRFCVAEGLANVIPLSVFRSPGFGRDYGVLLTSGIQTGLLSRAVVVIDREGTVVYTEQVPEIKQEPNYDAALKAVKGIK